MLWCQAYHQNKHMECKIMTGGLDNSPGVLYMGIVNDGVRCGDSRICLNQTCKDISPMMDYRCPQNHPDQGGPKVECSANGVSSVREWSIPGPRIRGCCHKDTAQGTQSPPSAESLWHQGVCNRFFQCMEATYHAITIHRKAENAFYLP